MTLRGISPGYRSMNGLWLVCRLSERRESQPDVAVRVDKQLLRNLSYSLLSLERGCVQWVFLNGQRTVLFSTRGFFFFLISLDMPVYLSIST